MTCAPCANATHPIALGEPPRRKGFKFSPQLQNLHELVAQIQMPDLPNRQRATEGFRRLLSLEKNPPIEEVIRQGVIPIFVEFLKIDDPKARPFAAWPRSMSQQPCYDAPLPPSASPSTSPETAAASLARSSSSRPPGR